MYTLNSNTEFRNLEEQVQKNKEDIARHYAVDRALSNLGIQVVGQVTSEDELPDPLTYEGEYGYAFAVGDKDEVDAGNATYIYYVWTRPDLNAGQPNSYWLNVGAISIIGPQGLRGPQGIQGEKGEATRWYIGYGSPSSAAGYNQGDLYLNTNTGDIFEYGSGSWTSPQGSIKGPQGIQGIQGPQGIQGIQGPVGPQGEKGDVGGFINIVGTLSSVDQLPLPTALDNLTYAYLVAHTGGSDQANDHNDLYIQVGENSEEAEWFNAGPFNAATLVTVGGEGQNVWDADSKVDKITGVGRVYATDSYGNATSIPYSDRANAGAIPKRDGSANFRVGAPISEQYCANKQYVDSQMSTRVPAVSTANKVYVTDASGNQTTDDRVIRSQVTTNISAAWTDFNDEEKEANYPYTCQRVYGYVGTLPQAKKIELLYNANVAKYGVSFINVTSNGIVTFYAVRKPTVGFDVSFAVEL